MKILDKHFGRAGNRMFQSAFLYAYARKNGIDWYFQDPKWFEGYENEIKKMFEIKGDPLDYVSIHVRRNSNPSNPDEPKYSENPFYVNLIQTDYYRKAMDRFLNEKFFIFSDDIHWCKDYFGKKHDYSYGTEEEDFNTMARCKHNIIANSSFSWWAAYLNPNPNKKVIYPLKWYADGIERTKCPKEWIGV